MANNLITVSPDCIVQASTSRVHFLTGFGNVCSLYALRRSAVAHLASWCCLARKRPAGRPRCVRVDEMSRRSCPLLGRLWRNSHVALVLDCLALKIRWSYASITLGSRRIRPCLRHCQSASAGEHILASLPFFLRILWPSFKQLQHTRQNTYLLANYLTYRVS
ncbi:hypothetical protein N658DRAFT_103354 [Parathielavia hyrcaniae]|uniref:Uncharacterized protein n=1 Tax=Parathielavia hyrcaniae TaxID=113614 RepID=A0AAN6Q2C4_9PEZI|nr:hypothetical protein N658DRAFT_103354 [Parathielavia hyrcaniae]